MIMMRFDCPDTAQPLASTLDVGQWPGRDDELVSMHCPKCSKLHSFRRAQAILAIEPGAHLWEAAGTSAQFARP